MNKHEFSLAGAVLHALPTGALHWPDAELLVVSDLHLGKSERIAKRSGQMLPPYEVIDTLTRLEDVIAATRPKTVLCLGDSFDDLDAASTLSQEHAHWFSHLQAGREWIWIEGNHDPGPTELGGTHLRQFTQGPLIFRHIAEPTTPPGEVTGHYHPKARISVRGRSISRPCFLLDRTRLILPSFGTYTGGLASHHDALCTLMEEDACAILTGQTPCAVPMPRS